MKKYNVEFIDHITKGVRNKTVLAENKSNARKKFNRSYQVPYPIISINLIK
ncbi:hypothetical protein [Clostridium sp.]|uniref:hypothetical protein n=1 Tax=Clostridium sp. TaxID=1506 RepID=UPI00321636D7